MPPEPANDNQREFRCIHCHGKILVPRDLPPTTGPCPHCQKEITSPGRAPEPELDPIFGKPVDDDTVGAPPPVPGVETTRQDVTAAAEAERKAAGEAEQKAREEAERKAAEEAERKAREEAERTAAEEAERKAREEAERKAAEEAERKAREEAERTAAEEAERKAREEAERKAAEEAEQKAREEAERKAAEEAERKAKEEAERKAAAEAERKASEQAEQKAAKEEAEQKAAEEAERKAREEAEQKASARAERRAAEVAEHQAHQAAERKEAERQVAEQAEVVRKAGEAAAAREASQREKDKIAMGFADSPLMAEAPPAKKVAPETPTAEPPVETSAGEELPPAPEKSQKAPEPSRKRRFPVAAVLVLAGLLALAGGSFVVVKNLQANRALPPPAVGPNDAVLREKQYLEKGWEEDAYGTLARFLEARRPPGKAAYSINGSSLLGEMESFYQSAAIDDSDTPAEAFSVFPLSMEDRERGIFMLVFDQPPVFEIDEFFAPLAPLDVQYKLREPDMLLATVARSSNFAAEPLKVQAIFKRTAEGLRLDWETFVQTKHRTLRDFLELPVAGREEVFRVIISETVPERRSAPAGHRTYLVSDPAHRSEDSARINVPVDSEVGRALSILNWRGTPDGRAISKTATLKLRWTREEIPRLELSKFICWEFLGVGGEAVDPSE
ncbi:hypothetical protein [Haloferula sp. A504]|uniref:hypothetical protein n=1 Tax=Haloferula sp. A504 TaxID=3373601 RepID=UPI0031C1C73C|nr:hypothetical protein [Verrucomicrobiaceae bacterium E54]